MDTRMKELGDLLKELEGKTNATSIQLNLLFDLNNHFYPQLLEYSKHCTSCVARTYKRMINHYNAYGKNIEN
jgi:hypothetical protein